nr:protein-glutamate O-methyltransferase CheR [Sphingomonas sp. BT553]
MAGPDGSVESGANGPPLGSAEFAAIAAIMQSDARIHLTDIKKTLVHGRLSRRLRMHGLTSFRDYVRMVQSPGEERAAMVVALTTNHTHFFRENHHFEHFREKVIPTLKDAVRRRPVRIWSAGCSSGEEVYTIAMCLLGKDRGQAGWLRDADLKLLATDLAPHVVDSVRQATYPDNVVAAIPADYRKAWLRPAAGSDHEMAPEARALVTAHVLNLFEAWPMRQQYDAIFCRNVMIYFDDRAKAELEARLVDQLAPGGHLYIGHSERLVGPAAAVMKGCGQTIYVKQEGGTR